MKERSVKRRKKIKAIDIFCIFRYGRVDGYFGRSPRPKAYWNAEQKLQYEKGYRQGRKARKTGGKHEKGTGRSI